MEPSAETPKKYRPTEKGKKIRKAFTRALLASAVASGGASAVILLKNSPASVEASLANSTQERNPPQTLEEYLKDAPPEVKDILKEGAEISVNNSFMKISPEVNKRSSLRLINPKTSDGHNNIYGDLASKTIESMGALYIPDKINFGEGWFVTRLDDGRWIAIKDEDGTRDPSLIEHQPKRKIEQFTFEGFDPDARSLLATRKVEGTTERIAIAQSFIPKNQ